MGGADTQDLNGGTLAVGGEDIVIPGSQLTLNSDGTITVPLPVGAFIGGNNITITRTQYAPLNGDYAVQGLPSNPVQLQPTGFYSVAVNSGDDSVSIIDSTTQAEVARIPLAAGSAPRNAVITADGTRAYVALSGVPGIAVIDLGGAAAGRYRYAATFGIQYLQLPPGAQPFDLAVEPTGRFLYVSDQAQGAVYVVDIDPFSKTFDRHVQTIAVGPAPLGLRGIALNSDGSMLFVTAPGRTLFGAYAAENGNLLVIQTNIATRKAPQFVSVPMPNVIAVGPEPYDITQGRMIRTSCCSSDRLGRQPGRGCPPPPCGRQLVYLGPELH